MNPPILPPIWHLNDLYQYWFVNLSFTEMIILIVCLILALVLICVLGWWLAIGKERFIEKRCPERLHKYEAKSSDEKIEDVLPESEEM